MKYGKIYTDHNTVIDYDISSVLSDIRNRTRVQREDNFLRKPTAEK
jgi:hypothetical protein